VASFDLPTPRVALAVGAHPDDVEFGCGATLAKWAAAGCVVHHVVCTDGSKGTWDVDADTAALARRRQVEQRIAARRLAGADDDDDRVPGDVRFLGAVDGDLAGDPTGDPTGDPGGGGRRWRDEIALAIRELRPDVVLGHDPWKRYRLHPDHRAAGFLVCDAVVAARDPHFLRHQLVAGITHHRPTALLLWEADEPNHAEHVEGWVDRKIHALEAHVSQFESTMHAVDADQLDDFRRRVAERLAGLGTSLGTGPVEVFRLLTDL
jgi:LmbE family N-acetylglucosaminyl deacetylase